MLDFLRTTIRQPKQMRWQTILIFMVVVLSAFPTLTQEMKREKIDAHLAYLLWMHSNPKPALAYRSILSQNAIKISIRFTKEPSMTDIHNLENEGLAFDYWQGKVLHIGPIYEAAAPWNKIQMLAARNDVENIEAAWKPDRLPMMNVSNPEVQANQAWKLLDHEGFPLTGKGVTIAVFDGIPDIFHPALWRADGDTLNWLDNNANGIFDGGSDGVDLNKNGQMDTGERLHFIDAKFQDRWGQFQNQIGVYEVDRDWLYNDADENQQRDSGKNKGFTEASPTYGEQLFICDDLNHNNLLDPDERLIALNTSKIKAIRFPSKVYYRGQNLIEAGQDGGDTHTTAVLGTLVGGWPGHHLFTGIAPEAEIILGSEAAWAAAMNADIMLYERGRGLVYEYLDGSSNDEQAVNFLAAQEIMQVIPAGNNGGSQIHFLADIPAHDSITVRIDYYPGDPPIDVVQLQVSFLWRAPWNNLQFWLITPEDQAYHFAGRGNDLNTPNFEMWSHFNVSSRGTAGMFMNFQRINDQSRNWKIRIKNNQSYHQQIDGYIFDPLFPFKISTFLDFVSPSRTVGSPATADSAIAVGAYDHRDFRGPAGALSSFSSQGPRIDGAPAITLVAPGNDVYTLNIHDTTTNSLGGYRPVSGTSFSGPHVAGAIALLLQKNPHLTHGEVRLLLRQGAASDQFTGKTPNDAWGAGKLRILNSINLITSVEEKKTAHAAALPQEFILSQNVPNPFSRQTEIAYQLNRSGHVSIAIFNILARR
ncbi:S8 family serine peptidase [candidate division KSB1 bacterium]|nr:S8 family serine peptidase [candidate division KSB1 bacterium]